MATPQSAAYPAGEFAAGSPATASEDTRSAETGGAPPVADRNVLIAGHVLFAVLLVIGAVRAGSGSSVSGGAGSTSVVASLAVAAVTAAWYVAGAVWIAGGRTGGGHIAGGRSARGGALPARVWLAGLLVLWLVLVALSAEFIWLAFLLAMLVWHLLPVRVAAPVDAAVAVVTVTAFAWHQGSWQVGAVIGPVVGIASAVVMTEIYQRLRAQSEERRRLLDELVRTQAALAEREREAGRLAERERLAADIHDTVGQSLSSVILLLRAALAETARADTPPAEDGPPDAGEHAGMGEASVSTSGTRAADTNSAARAHEAHRVQLTTALDATLTALGETRRLVRGLAPEAIEKAGLRAALAALANETSALGTPTSYAEHGTPLPLTRPAEVALLRAAQEAVTNARKHADASAISLTLTYQDDEASIDIVDDGHGIRTAVTSGVGGAAGLAGTADLAGADGSGYGLTAMRARIADCGGTVDIESEPGGGTAVRATVPIVQTGPAVQTRPA